MTLLSLAEPRPDARQALALLGEAEAARALTRAGMTLLERRFRRRFGELDLIALDGELVVFVEVKTRRSGATGRPADSVTPRKRHRMAKLALAYLSRRGWLERRCRFDVVEVIAGGVAKARVHHIVDAFRIWPTG